MEEYDVMIYKNDKIEDIGVVRVNEDGTGEFVLYFLAEKKVRKLTDNEWFYETRRGDMKVATDMLCEENRQTNRRRAVYYCDEFIFKRRAKHSGKSYLVYDRGAKEGEQGYSEKNHSVPHYEPDADNMEEWVNHYKFNALDDGTYEAELDEAWYGGGSHTDGGTIYDDIFDGWQDLPYDEFLDKVLGCAAARHFLFTIEDLKACEGLKEFFGYQD